MVGHDALNVGTVVRIHLSEFYFEIGHLYKMFDFFGEVSI